MQKHIAVRLEGGLGDHILGLRLVPFIRQRFPNDRIVLYSDCGGFRSQLEACAMCSHSDEVVPVFQDRTKVTLENAGSLENICSGDMLKIQSADLFFDAWPGPPIDPMALGCEPGLNDWVTHARRLNMPFYEIFASIPELQISHRAVARASEIIPFHKSHRIVAINFQKGGPNELMARNDALRSILSMLLQDSRLYVANIFTADNDFPHLFEPLRVERCAKEREAALILERLGEVSDRVVAVKGQDISTIAAVLRGSDYFLGVDNGIKHLAWSLGVEHSFFAVKQPQRASIMRWIPDYHRLIVPDGSSGQLLRIVEEVRSSLH